VDTTVRHLSHCGNDPGPGRPGHVHHDVCRDEHPDVDDATWAAYGDRYPGSYCRWLTDTLPGQRELERRQRGLEAQELWLRVHRPTITTSTMRKVSA
jgi:hypothetical protein